MRRGSTPIHTFTLPVDTSIIDKLRITYVQQGEIVLIKTKDDATLAGNTIVVKLTQVETLKFCANRAVEIQVEALTSAGDKLQSDIMCVGVDRCLNNEVLE